MGTKSWEERTSGVQQLPHRARRRDGRACPDAHSASRREGRRSQHPGQVTTPALARGGQGELSCTLWPWGSSGLCGSSEGDSNSQSPLVLERSCSCGWGPSSARGGSHVGFLPLSSSPDASRIRVKRYRQSMNNFQGLRSFGCRFGTCTVQKLAHQIYQFTDKDKDGVAPRSKISPQGYGRRRRRSLPEAGRGRTLLSPEPQARGAPAPRAHQVLATLRRI